MAKRITKERAKHLRKTKSSNHANRLTKRKAKFELKTVASKWSALILYMEVNMYADITQQIIKKIEDGCPPWLRPYNKVGGGLPLRHNGVPYRGMNIIMLWMCDFDNPYWMTYQPSTTAWRQLER